VNRFFNNAWCLPVSGLLGPTRDAAHHVAFAPKALTMRSAVVQMLPKVKAKCGELAVKGRAMSRRS
jgi:hypothetical protein